MDTTTTTTPAPSTFDTVLAVLLAGAAGSRWMLLGWAEHIRAARAAQHAANSFAKHRAEFGLVEPQARALAVARCVDYGLTPDEAAELLGARCAARDAKAAS